MIAATPGELLLHKAFTIMLNFIMTGNFPYNEVLKIIEFNTDAGVHFITNLMEHSINVVLFHEKQLEDRGFNHTNYLI